MVLFPVKVFGKNPKFEDFMAFSKIDDHLFSFSLAHEADVEAQVSGVTPGETVLFIWPFWLSKF